MAQVPKEEPGSADLQGSGEALIQSPVQSRQQSQENVALDTSGGSPVVMPIEVSGGRFETAYLGPLSSSSSGNIGVASSNLQGAQIGTSNYHTSHHYYQTVQDSRTRRMQDEAEVDASQKRFRAVTDKDNPNRCQLTDSIWIFKDRPLARKARVYEGEEITMVMRRSIAIKFVEFHPKKVREAKNLLKLTPHANVTAIIHADTSDIGPMKSIYIAMDRCSTTSLQTYIEDQRKKNIPFNLKRTLLFTKQVVDGIEHIHKNNILHRDLKPSSFLFSMDGNYLKVVDFGVSKELKYGHSTTHLSTLKIGTDGYRAPETYIHDSITKQADVFQLGLVLFYLWSYGFHPFGNDAEIWNYNIKNNNPPDMSRLLIPNRDAAVKLLKKIFSFDPKLRPKIEEVKNDAFIASDCIANLLASMNQLWQGNMKVLESRSVISGRLFANQEANTGIDGEGWKIAINSLPKIDISPKPGFLGKEPAGYLAVGSNSRMADLMKSFVDRAQIGWIDIAPDEKEKKAKAIVLVSTEDGSETYGIYLEDPQYFMARIRGLVPTPEIPPEEVLPVPQPETEPAPSVPVVEETVPKQVELTPQPVVTPPPEESEEPVAMETSVEILPQSLHSDGRTEPEKPAPARASAPAPSQSSAVDFGRNCPDLVPWWFFAGNFNFPNPREAPQ